jgi:hypothetical protein
VKQNINPKLAIAIVVGVLIIVAISAVRTLRGPVATGPSEARRVPRAEMDKQMREAHQMPTGEQMNRIQEYKRTHPNATTRF